MNYIVFLYDISIYLYLYLETIIFTFHNWFNSHQLIDFLLVRFISLAYFVDCQKNLFILLRYK